MDRDIKYINRDFGDFKEQLIEFSKNYFPDTYNDFTVASPGMMFMEMAAYVGDVLSFYQDIQLQETFLQYAKDPANLYSLAYMMGYRPRVTNVSEVDLTVTQRVAATGSNYEPNWNQALRIPERVELIASVGTNTSFITQDVVDFRFSGSYSPTEVVLYSVDELGKPLEYQLKKTVRAISGEIKTVTRSIGSVEKFLTLEISDENIVGILDIVDSDLNTWVEVPCLGQDTVFVEENNGTGIGNVPFILGLKKVPRRFVTRFTSKGTLQVQFGAGVTDQNEDIYLPNPINTEAGTQRDVSKYDVAYDPSNFLFSNSYGMSPSNTVLTIRYIVGGGVQANVPANSILATGLSVYATATDNTYRDTLEIYNEVAARGGRDGDTIEELRQNAMRAYAEQKRVVSLEDYKIRALSLPSKFGTIAKAFAVREYAFNAPSSDLTTSPFSISLYVLGLNGEGKLTQANSIVKNNLKTYLSQYIMVTDAVDIKDAYIVNIGVKFEVITLPNYTPRDVLLQCNLKLQEYFNIRRWSIGEPINIASIYTLLDRVKGVQTVKKITVVNKTGEGYSEYAYDVEGAIRDNILYPSYDPCIFEVRYPEIDIEGRVTTL